LKARKISFAILIAFTLVIFLYFTLCFIFLVSDSYALIRGYSVNDILPFGISAEETVETSDSGRLINKNVIRSNSNDKVTLKIFGIIPVKEVSVSHVENTLLYPSGECIGIKMYSGGIIVTGFSDFDTPNGVCVSPGAVAGVEKGDVIMRVNGTYTSSVAKFTEIVNSVQEDCTLGIKRNGKEIEIKISPAVSTDGNKRLGLLVKNSVAGVGTMTYVTKSKNTFAALGHGVTEGETGVILPMQSATVYSSDIIRVVKGKRGAPGELAGVIDEDKLIGECTCNSKGGIFGVLTDYSPKTKPLYAASRSEIKEGNASILCTVDEGGKPKEYGVKILSVNRMSKNKTKSFVIEITDKELLSKTGGIIQGMSGSPVLQNGKIVGAVTHVFVNDPTRGYGIFIENMLAEAEKIK